MSAMEYVLCPPHQVGRGFGVCLKCDAATLGNICLRAPVQSAEGFQSLQGSSYSVHFDVKVEWCIPAQAVADGRSQPVLLIRPIMLCPWFYSCAVLRCIVY
jgi:hypothetical protein